MTNATPQDPRGETNLTPARRLNHWFRTGGWRALAGATAGASLLAAYAYFIGCHTGTCLLTSNVQAATLTGGLVGLVTGWPAPPRKESVPVKP
jgi:hypothetical protein